MFKKSVDGQPSLGVINTFLNKDK